MVEGKNPGDALCCLRRDTDKFIGHLPLHTFYQSATGREGKGYVSTVVAVFPFQAHNAEPCDRGGGQHARRIRPASLAAHDN